MTVSRQQITLDKPIKEIGLHVIEIVLHADVTANITINVARSEDEAERQARGENVLLTDDEREAEEAAAAAAELFENEPPAAVDGEEGEDTAAEADDAEEPDNA